mgnify:FL=1
MTRHGTFQQVIEGHFTGNISADLDKVYKIDNTKWTLRDMILSIKSSGKETGNIPLFHMVDYTSDSISQWFGGIRGPGGTGYIFSFFRKLKEEAISMVEGLPIYLATIYGKDNVRRFPPMETWKNL